jgi:hypothetical protein
MIRALLLAALFWSAPAHAQPFAEAGLGVSNGGCIYRNRLAVMPNAWPVTCSSNPLAVIALGWRFGDSGWRLQWEHWSAPLQDDRGVEMVTLRYRIDFK